MTPTTATLALQFCNAVFTACPWAAPSTWTPPAKPDLFGDLFNMPDVFAGFSDWMKSNHDTERP